MPQYGTNYKAHNCEFSESSLCFSETFPCGDKLFHANVKQVKF